MPAKKNLLKRTVLHFAEKLELELDVIQINKAVKGKSLVPGERVEDFAHGLIQLGSALEIAFEHIITDKKSLRDIIETENPIILFYNRADGAYPIVVQMERNNIRGKLIDKEDSLDLQFASFDELDQHIEYSPEGTTHCVLGMSTIPSFSYSHIEQGDPTLPKLTPMRRFFRLLATEKKEITYLYVYAIMSALLSLTLPLGVQAIIGFVSGGSLFDSLILLIGLVLVGIILNGVFQIMQITIVEYIQRRIFAKAAFEFAFRITRIRYEALHGVNPVELMNRFFDIINVQKGLSKVLIDFVTALLQIIFGIILLSFYHSFFIFFGFLLLFLMFILFRYTVPRSISTSLLESKYKYKVVAWLEEVARAIDTFKLSGNTTNLPIEKTDYLTGNYLYARKSHFKVLMTQYINLVALKTLVTGGLLVIGSILVVGQQMNIGQFVAAEIVIVLIVSSVDKLMGYIDALYDTFTAVEKVGHVTDLPIEDPEGIDATEIVNKKGFDVMMTNVTFKYPGQSKPTLNGCTLHIERGKRLCLSGPSGSGKTTLTDIVEGLFDKYQGSITYNSVSGRDINIDTIRAYIGGNSAYEDVFEATIKENITMGRSDIRHSEVVRVMKLLGIENQINNLENGLETQLSAGGVGINKDLSRRIILARGLVFYPELLIIHDFFADTPQLKKLEIYDILLNSHTCNTILTVSNDPEVAAMCDEVVIMRQGQIVSQAPFDEIKDQYAQLIV